MKDGTFKLIQPFLIDRVLKLLGISDSKDYPKRTPVGKPLLCKDVDDVERKYSWNYRSAIGMLNYLQNSTRPEIAMAVHQCARFNNDPKLSHEKAVMRLGKYLLGTRGKGLVFKPDVSRGLECFVDADFAGSWSKADAENAESVYSRTGFLIRYAGCPVYW